MIPIVATLVSQGLGLIGNAVLSKGKEYIEEKTGIKLTQDMSEDNLLKLKQFEMEHEEELMRLRLEDDKLSNELYKAKLEAINIENQEVSKRWSADMSSDSWLSKNVRPMTLIFILAIYTLMAFASGFGLDIPISYVELLGQWGMLIMSAYFGGRTIEKVVEMRAKQ